MASFLLLSFFALAQSQTPTPTPGTCYTPQGVPIPGQQACNAYLQVSSCCPKGATCFSNQLCILTDPDEVGNGLSLGAVLRGGCTNPLWSNSICGSFCLGNGDDGSISACGNQQYCCQSGVKDGSCNCDTGKGVFSLADGVAQTIIGVSGLDATTIPPVSHSSTSITTPSTATVTTTSSSKSQSASASRASGTTTSTGSAPSRTSAAAPTPLVHTTGFKAGMGAGFGVLALVLSFAIWRWCRGRRHDRRWPFSTNPPNPYPYNTTLNTSNDDGRPPPARITQPTTAPFPNPYEPSAAGSIPSPVNTPPPQTRPGQSRDMLGVAPTNNPYDSAYSLPSRGANGFGNPNPHPYGAPPLPERVGETLVPQDGIELGDFHGQEYRDPRRMMWHNGA